MGFECMYTNRNPTGGGGLAPLTPHLSTHGRRLIYVAYFIYACIAWYSQESCNGGSNAYCTRIEMQWGGGGLPHLPFICRPMVVD